MTIQKIEICNKCGVKFIAADELLVCPECIWEMNRNNDYDLEPTMEMLKDGEGVTW